VLSNGHGSMLLYALLHLTGYDLPMEELKRFRQLGSKTPGTRSTATRRASRPPPGRSARASPTRWAWRSPSAARGALQQARARAGRPLHLRLPRRRLHDGRHLARGLRPRRHPGLGKLIALYDDNGISIDSDKGQIKQWYTDDVPQALRVLRLAGNPNVDGHDIEAVDKAIARQSAAVPAPTPGRA
jgi:transketolase